MKYIYIKNPLIIFALILGAFFALGGAKIVSAQTIYNPYNPYWDNGGYYYGDYYGSNTAWYGGYYLDYSLPNSGGSNYTYFGSVPLGGPSIPNSGGANYTYAGSVPAAGTMLGNTGGSNYTFTGSPSTSGNTLLNTGGSNYTFSSR
jgi:hypothetical protein